MTVSNASYLKGFHESARALGTKVVSSDFTLEIEGHESKFLLCKQAPWPSLAPAGEIEIAGPLGMTSWQPQQAKVAQQGQISFYETVGGHSNMMLMDLIARGSSAEFNAKIYEGTPQKFIRAVRIQDCFIQMDPVDRDQENRSQVLLLSGTMFYHYFGEIIEGNSADYR